MISGYRSYLDNQSQLEDFWLGQAAAGLETLHGHSTALFQGAITDRLHTALEPR